jgi:hypothetical protein
MRLKVVRAIGDYKQKHGTLDSVRFQDCRDDDVGIDDEPERDHPRFGFWGFLGARGLDDLVNPPQTERIGAFALRFLADHAERFRLRSGKPHVIADAEQHRPRRTAFFNHQRAAFGFHTAQQVAKIGTGA